VTHQTVRPSDRPTDLLKFFGLTYAVSWALWALVALIPPGTTLRTTMFLPGTFAPALVALWLAPRRQELIDRVFHWQVPGRWYVFALGYLATVKLAAAIVYRIVAGRWPTLEPGPWLLFVGAILVSTPFQAGEEIGWRGYALPRLTQRFGLGLASTMLGVIWAAWHLPLFFIRATDHTGGSFPVYLITVTGISIAMGWLYARTNCSLLLVMLMHSAANNTPHFVPPGTPGNVFALNATMAQWLTALLLWIGAGYLLLRMRGRLLRLGAF
jgi:membrane protease YdiL (CAAX protease family)